MQPGLQQKGARGCKSLSIYQGEKHALRFTRRPYTAHSTTCEKRRTEWRARGGLLGCAIVGILILPLVLLMGDPPKAS